MKLIPILIILILSFACDKQSPNTPNKTPSWNHCYTLPKDGVYKDIFFIDANNGWLVGESDRILHSNNGGKNWELQNITDNSGIHPSLLSIHFIDSKYGWATGYRSALYTIDGGTVWNAVDLVGYGRITMPTTEKIFFIDRENILMFFSNRVGNDFIGVSRYTFDVDSAKFSWFSSHQIPHILSSVTNVHYKIWFADVKQNIHISTDGGVKWSTRQIDDNSCGDISAINDIYFMDEQKGWICSHSSVYHSNDGGNNWHCKASLSDSSLSKIYFFNYDGWGMGEKIIYYSSNGGESWQEQYQVGGDEKLVSISFVNDSNGWALSENGNVYRYGIE